MPLEHEIGRFENIGDNCEFGFVKRHLGNEDGGLLRWASTPPHALIAALKDRFQSLYRFENLTPAWDNMLTDTAYGIGFHTHMKSRDKQWVHDGVERERLHREELEKIHYLVGKFLKRIADPRTICVYKTNAGLTVQQEEGILTALRALGPASLLVVRTTDQPAQVGTITQANGYLIGHIDRFADYAQADQISDAWFTLVRSTLQHLRT
ncbi:hypothetical protein AA0472_3111 [Acetobacter estunensis NRIC 0472]|uniref:Papain-like cysteine peptidase n=1 Tax=Acetobacter estunensis TaxID=104097 RepID=A0A967EH15_9PROT|nr:hypothetical protein [Acetobacter estunensis]NHO53062.1 hypothetical protein [Acetobacter estunensis]GBQ29819.1 hypothetical protein AA0472_3111 [Acetobacter estunensis NRIC 0472]